MAVRVLFETGHEQRYELATAASPDVGLIRLTRWNAKANLVDTIATIRTVNVVRAEILDRHGVVIGFLSGDAGREDAARSE